jgi:hypothetical protein
MIRILILYSMCNLLSMNDMLSCEILGVYKLKKTFITTYSRGNAKNTKGEELYFVVTKAPENDFANVYFCGIYNSKAPLYKKQSTIQDSINFQSFRAISKCSHIMKDNKLLKNNEIHEYCPINKFFENRDTANPFMSLSLNDNNIVSSNNMYTVKMITSIEKTNWSDRYVNNLSFFVQKILTSELPKVHIGGELRVFSNKAFDSWNTNDGNLWNSFIIQNLPISNALRSIVPNHELSTKYYTGSYTGTGYKEGYDTLFKWNLDKCILIEDAIFGRNSGLLIDLYSREQGTYTEDEFMKLKHLINQKKMEYKHIDTLIQHAKQLVINEDKIDTTLINFQNMLSNTIAMKKKVQDFKSDIFNTFLSSPLLITSFDEKPKIDDTLSLFISVRNKIRKENSTTTYASMIDSNFYAFYYRGILDYDERNSNYEYTESKIFPVKNLLDTLKLLKQKNILLLDDIPFKVDKSTEQIRAHIKYYHQNFKKLYNTVKTNVFSDNNLNIYLTKFDSLLLDLDSKCEVPKFVSYSNYSIKKPFNSLEAYRLHKFILRKYESSLPHYWGEGSFELNEMEKIKKEGYYEYNCRINYSPYQEIAPMLLAYTKEFSKQSTTMNYELIFDNNLGKLGYVLGLDSNQFKLDILHYFKECEFDGPTLNYFDETKNIAFSWGFENTKTKDSIALIIATIDSLLNNNISDISKQIDNLKIKNSGIDHKIQINMLEYKPYCAFVNYYQLQKPDIVLDELSKKNVELTPQKIDSIYQHYRNEDKRLKDLEKKSIFTIFRDDKTVRTSPVLDFSDKRLQLVRSFIIDSINTLKKINNASYLDEIYYTYLPNDMVKKMILDSLSLLHKRLDKNIKRFIYNEEYQDLVLPRPPNLDFLNEDSLYASILRLRSKYFKIFDEYALNFVSIDTVSKNLITNIPRVPLTHNICDVATLYNKSKGFGSEWNLKSDSLIVTTLSWWLKNNRNYGQMERGFSYGGSYRSQDMRYDIDRDEWIIQSKDSYCEREDRQIYMLFKLNDSDFKLTSLFIDSQ